MVMMAVLATAMVSFMYMMMGEAFRLELFSTQCKIAIITTILSLPIW